MTVMTKRDFDQYIAVPLAPSNKQLQTYTDQPVPILGECLVSVKCQAKQVDLPLIVVKGEGPPLLGRNWLQCLRLDWPSLFSLSDLSASAPPPICLEDVLNQNSEVFGESGLLKDRKVRLSIKSDSVPRLLRKGEKEQWAKEQEDAFHRDKEILSSKQVLVHFDASKKIILICDASPDEVGAFLSHEESSGSFGKSKPLPEHAAPRVQRWAITLAVAAYTYQLKYRPGSENNADAFSRLPLQQNTKEYVPEDIEMLFSVIDTAELMLMML
ncbi:hypothetical protein EGW08_020894 [Elysia chlorotica]|uniref:Reverse transcriptase/retrotransposon-derived protein RNase H-like domain-containing protein n=1 Tax=Elysia chlorotica TaxID=188477 RepID=A0A3S1BNU5_ELYCH|nr:hypothetical protein EGW08_020894 [Elysia chlorotica]